MNLSDPAFLKEFLVRHGLWASKGLGQHFLVSQKVVAAITEAMHDCKGILEIGPGPGVLTAPLSEMSEKLVAVELDDRMISALADSSPRATVTRANALEVDLRAILEDLPEPRGVVSNLPYYITGPLLTRIAEARGSYSRAILMMQREVAERVVAAPKTSARGSLSVFLQLQFDIRLVARVPAGAFLPPPKVDSTVLEFVPNAGHLHAIDEGSIFKLIRFGFQQPRKTLINNLISGYGLDREAASSWVASIGLSSNARPQELTNAQWIELHKANPTLKGEGTP